MAECGSIHPQDHEVTCHSGTGPHKDHWHMRGTPPEQETVVWTNAEYRPPESTRRNNTGLNIQEMGRTLSSPTPAMRLPGDAGDTQREEAARREPRGGTIKRRILDVIIANPGITDYGIEQILGMRHQQVSATRNSLMLDGLITLHPDPGGKDHPLKRRMPDGEIVVLSRGPWAVERSVDEDGEEVALLRWYAVEEI